MDFKTETINITFSNLPIFWKTITIIGILASFIFIVLLIIIISLMFESKLNTKKIDEDLSVYDDFIDEFTKSNTSIIDDSYPSLPKIKDLNGNYLKDLLQIDII